MKYIATTVFLLALTCTRGRSSRFEDGAQEKVALLVVDVQPDFMPGGALPTDDAQTVVQEVRNLLSRSGDKYTLIAFSLDCHPPGHVSFASEHGLKPFSDVELVYSKSGRLTCKAGPSTSQVPCSTENEGDVQSISQHLWPDHCVSPTLGAQLHLGLSSLLRTPEGSDIPAPSMICNSRSISEHTHYLTYELRYPPAFFCGVDEHVTLKNDMGLVISQDHSVLTLPTNDDEMDVQPRQVDKTPSVQPTVPAVVVLKGIERHMDAYSAFYDNGHISHTGLHEALQKYGITRLHVVGLALDVCVAATARDAVDLGYDVTIIQDACKAVHEDDRQQTLQQLHEYGIHIMSLADVIVHQPGGGDQHGTCHDDLLTSSS